MEGLGVTILLSVPQHIFHEESALSVSLNVPLLHRPLCALRRVGRRRDLVDADEVADEPDVPDCDQIMVFYL